MLDSETKARIDSARDVLVGKVPDPKSQVEQITIALIYKFMDDMDRQSEELGGKASFFSDGFKKYAWHKLLDARLSGHERLLLYAEGIEKMTENKQLPQLFRDIFRGAFLPYRDPETLNLFLKEINGFTYDHSERLGDAFEYLLSVLGSQGEAGQFRTPRHIIDFIVQIIDPTKHETILDPACGTAGFLISAYKHILAANSKERSGDLLTADERGRLMDNFCGYDISPDMVRLSRANMYLHRFPQPRIHEYDTLTSEERWDERYDVIMANPPFMSPKGGIRPHNRFSIKATRSEVLFVDYITEHLNVNGRAGVIVPEGIIFQSQNAYKTLRKMLVENYLWCVVSLPAGVFNPYSGVKTSILLMDKALAKRTAEILFVRIENDGFDLGAQRRPIEKNDLPEAKLAIQRWRNQRETECSLAHAVGRARILDSSDYSFSGDSYKDQQLRESKIWPMVPIEEFSEIDNGFAFKSDEYVSSGLRVIRIANVQKGIIVDSDPKFIAANRKVEFTKFLLHEGDLLVSLTGNVGRVGRIRADLLPAVLNQRVARLRLSDAVVPTYLYLLLNYGPFEQDAIRASSGMAQLNLSTRWLGSYTLPLPPLAEQKELVSELECYRRVIESARQVLANYKPTLRIDPKWREVALSSLAEFKNGINYSKANKGAGIKVLGVANFQDNLITPTEGLDQINPKGIVTKDDLLQDGDILFVRSNGNKALVGRSLSVRTNGEAITHSAFTIRLRFSEKKILPMFYAFLFRSPIYRAQLTGRGANINNLSQDILRNLVVPFPSIRVQREIVRELEAERTLVEANRELIARMEKKMQAKLAEIWGDSE